MLGMLNTLRDFISHSASSNFSGSINNKFLKRRFNLRVSFIILLNSLHQVVSARN